MAEGNRIPENPMKFKGIDNDVYVVKQGFTTVSKPTILIIADSRMEEVHHELKSLVFTPYIIVTAFRLLTSEIGSILDYFLTTERIKYVLLATGICDLTGMVDRLFDFT